MVEVVEVTVTGMVSGSVVDEVEVVVVVVDVSSIISGSVDGVLTDSCIPEITQLREIRAITRTVKDTAESKDLVDIFRL